MNRAATSLLRPVPHRAWRTPAAVFTILLSAFVGAPIATADTGPFAAAWLEPIGVELPDSAGANTPASQTAACQRIQAAAEHRANSGAAPRAALTRRAPEMGSGLLERPSSAAQCRAQTPALAAESAPGDISLNLAQLDYYLDLLDTPNQDRGARQGVSEIATKVIGSAARIDPGAFNTQTLPQDLHNWDLSVAANCAVTKVPADCLHPQRVPGVLSAAVTQGSAAAVAARQGLILLRSTPLALTGDELAVYAARDALALTRLATDSDVLSAQPEWVYRVSVGTEPMNPGNVNDPLAQLNYGPAQSGAADLWQRSTGAGRRIAVIDTGIDTRHPELVGRVENLLDATGKGFSPDAHGTAVAGIIAAAAGNNLGAFGVAPQATIVALKACQPRQAGGMASQCWTSTLVQALDAAVAANVDLVNMSLAGPPDALLARHIQAARAAGVLIVAAAGNGGPHAKPAFPAALPGVLAVTAIDRAESLYTRANRGDYIDIAAPGVDVLTTAPQARYPTVSGTSFAAAHISGAIALIRDLARDADADSVLAALRRHAGDLGSQGRDAEYGLGGADVCASAADLIADNLLCAEVP